MSVKIPAGLTLSKGEKVLFYGRLAWAANIGLIILGLLTIWFFGLGIIFFIIAALRVYASEYMISNRRVYVKYGLISRRTTEARLEWITDIHVRQGFLGRILNYGHIVFATPSGPVTSVIMYGVHDPMYVRGIVMNWIKKIQDIERVKKKLEDLEREYEFGRLSEEKYKELKEKYEREILTIESEV